ncbi:MAG: ABC transporter substrate-binding protein, partial [Desulfobacterales bacterium]|nr:ABC transporter substrate-binding protein [Desulfobacterales bacterium]
MELLKKVVLFLSLVLLLSAVGVSYGGEVRGVTDRSVKIGLMGGMTGPAAEVWVPIAHGVKAFFKKVNNEGGVHGRKIEYLLEDDRYSIPLALSGFKKLVYKDKIFALQGASGVGH